MVTSRRVMASKLAITAETIAKVRDAFVSKRGEIVRHTKPWTPWALAHLLEIDDTKSAVPAEVILYKALRGKGRTGIGQRDAVVQVQSNPLYSPLI